MQTHIQYFTVADINKNILPILNNSNVYTFFITSFGYTIYEPVHISTTRVIAIINPCKEDELYIALLDADRHKLIDATGYVRMITLCLYLGIPMPVISPKSLIIDLTLIPDLVHMYANQRERQ